MSLYFYSDKKVVGIKKYETLLKQQISLLRQEYSKSKDKHKSKWTVYASSKFFSDDKISKIENFTPYIIQKMRKKFHVYTIEDLHKADHIEGTKKFVKNIKNRKKKRKAVVIFGPIMRKLRVWKSM